MTCTLVFLVSANSLASAILGDYLAFILYSILLYSSVWCWRLSFGGFKSLLEIPTINDLTLLWLLIKVLKRTCFTVYQRVQPVLFQSIQFRTVPYCPASFRVRPSCRLVPQHTCFEIILHRDLSCEWVNFVRLASVRVAPLDVNLDMALVEALLEVVARVTELAEVSVFFFFLVGCLESRGKLLWCR